MNNSSEAPQRMRVGLLDFEPLRIAGLREIFAQHPDFQVVATDWAAAFKETSFDLVVVVLREQAFSLALLARLRSRHPGLKVLVIGSGSEPERILEAITAGAKGWLEETATPKQVMQAAYAVLAGSIWAPRKVLSAFVDRALEGSAARRRRTGPRFTEREEEVLQQLVLARSNREIAQALSIREQTVKSYVARLMRKVGVGNRIALSVQAASGAWGEKDR
ncbi:MAG TPA: response regulator transcription factor [Acidobacteriaceae bacterium]|nr:response regulator transcription factor [Acidobacteriaceae bacterium]